MRRTAIAATVGATLALTGALAIGTPAVGAGPVGAPDANDGSVVVTVPEVTLVPQPGTRAGITANEDGVCHQYSNGFGDLCLWYYQDFTGSLIDLFTGDCNLSDDTFITPGAGQGSAVSNNAESDWNYDLVHTARLWTGSNCTGTWGDISPGTGGNLNGTFRNNVEGFYFY